MIRSMPSSEFPPKSTPAAPSPKQQRIAEKNPPCSESLQQQTRAAVAQLSITQDGHLRIKHTVLEDAALFAFDDALLVHSFRDGRKWKYSDVEALLTDGWVIDQASQTTRRRTSAGTVEY